MAGSTERDKVFPERLVNSRNDVRHRPRSKRPAVLLHILTRDLNLFSAACVLRARAKEPVMPANTEELNPTLAIAIQAKRTEKRQTPTPAEALRARFEDDDRFRRLAAGGFSIATGTPAVCTIH